MPFSESVKISLIIPTWNEAKCITDTLVALQSLRKQSAEIIVIDGGSNDNTMVLAQTLADLVICEGKGRAQQMNAGARHSKGTILLFLHADTKLPENALKVIMERIGENPNGWGRFDVRLSGKHPLLRIVELLMNWRSRLSGIATGDQGIFVHRNLYNTIGGFPAIPLMEDIALSRALKRRSLPICLHERVITSSRRWEQHGILRTVVLMWRLRLAYAMGVDPYQLVHKYHKR